MRILTAAAFVVWAGWAVLVLGHYFVIPEELLIVLDHPVDGLPFWRAALNEAVRACGGTALILLAAWGAGWLAIHRADDLFRSAVERVVIVVAAGLAALGGVYYLLAALGLYRPHVAGAMVIALAAAGLIGLAPRLRRLAWTRSIASSHLSWQDVMYACAAAAGLTVAMIAALAPETEYDALWYHLWLPSQWLQAGRPVDIVEEYICLYPLGWDIVAGAGAVLGGAGAAKLLHFTCLSMMGACAGLLTRQLFPGASVLLAAALAIVTPITLWEASTAYVDLALAWFLSASSYALVRYFATADRRWLMLGALLMGAALASKHLALAALAIAVCVIASRELLVSRNAGRAIGSAALFVAISIALPAPWYARSYLASGNPVFPDLYGVFGAEPPERWSPVAERGLQAFKDRFGSPRTPIDLVRLPWDMTIHAAAFGGTLGPLFLILVPAAVAGTTVRAASAGVSAVCLAYIGVWASPVSSYQMRFVIPIVPLLAALGAEGAARLERAARAINPRAPALVQAVVLAVLALNLPPTAEWHEPDRRGYDGWMTHILRDIPLAVVAGGEQRRDYLHRKLASYGAWEYINASVPEDSRVLTFSGGDHFYAARRRLWSDSTLARPATWGTSAGEEAEALRAMRALSITHVLFDKRQLQDGSARALAIGSDAMRQCCLKRLYEDPRFVLYHVEPPRTVQGGGVSGSAFHE